MGSEGRIQGIVLTFMLAASVCGGCQEYTETESMHGKVKISWSCPGLKTRSLSEHEDRIYDMNLIIFEDGHTEECIFIEYGGNAEEEEISTSLLKNRTYTFYAVANYGERLDVSGMDELEETFVEVDREFRKGIPMTASCRDVTISEDTEVRLELIRMASRISIRMDRSRLSGDVSMDIRRVSIGNWPRYARLEGTNKVGSVYDRFDIGYEVTGEECRALNAIGAGGLSGSVSLYMLENMQGRFPHTINEDEEKVLEEDDPLYDRCSYVEIEIHYSTPELISYDSNLIYRFYLGEGLKDLDVERNCHYSITVAPEDDGLSGSGWRVDKSGIGPSTPYFRIMPGDYIEGHVGEQVHIWCEFYPGSAPFDPGYEELNYDKGRGIYDYAIDDDGHGVTLTLKKPGTGIVYMTAGEPVNRSGMAIVVVKPAV